MASTHDSPPQTVLVSGASGMIGTELLTQLAADGHTVRKLVRHAPSAPDQVQWSPGESPLDASVLDGVDAVINLSGASIGRIPWTPSYKKEILASRIDTTDALTDAMARASTPPARFLNASAVGIYGDRPGEELDEHAAPGTGFLAEVVEEWEAAADQAPDAVKVTTLRTGVVVGDGGALKPLLAVTRLGAGARVASGRQNWPWISLYDEAAAIRHLLTSDLTGPVNLAGPTPATANRITAYLAAALHRPYLFVLPRAVISLGMGEAGRELLLPSQLEVPAKLLEDGFRFRHETAEAAIDALLAEKQQ